MSHEYTQQQSADDELRSRQLSLKQSRPPLEVPGYRIERFLGAGAYGEVWVAIDRNTGRHVAIKFFAHRQGVDWSLLSREVEKLVFLSADRYVVQLLEVGWDAEPPFYVMEYVESGSLEDLIRDAGRLPVEEAVELFREICVGLAHAHTKGVLHCDLKPANILLDQDHHPRLADFGQSRLSSEQTPALGTLFYMAPEQADLAAVPDVRWDVYALGAILHCMLVGTPPYRSENVASELETTNELADRLARYRRAIRSSPPPEAHRRVPGIDRALVEIINRCLETNPDARYLSAQEVLRALEERQRTRQRRPLLAFGFVFPLLILLVIGLFGWRGYQQALSDTEQLATDQALDNNTFAARLAAQQVAGEIQRYFSIVDDEANRRPVFDEAYQAVRNHELLAKLADADATAEQLRGWQSEFRADASRTALDEYLARRLRKHKAHPRLASMFVLDAAGTQVAAAFSGGEPSRSIGRNLAFRTYFHGGPIDLPETVRVGEALKPITDTHLSAVFQSTTTGLWKIAVSTPIKRTTNDREETIGYFVITVNMGDFEVFQQVQPDAHYRLAALVDGRPGQHTGVILQHPLFAELDRQGDRLPDSFREYRVSIDANGEMRSKHYRDPLANDPEGRSYRGQWIASAEPVVLIGETKPSGLVVLVQEDYQQVTGPVRQLGQRLLREGMLAFAVVVLVTGLVWLAVLRLMRRPRTAPRLRTVRTSTEHATGEPTLVVGSSHVEIT
jgi:serine/threonine protein kinase